MADEEAFDLDDWFGYTTKKTVYIRDRHLGFIYYGLVTVIILYIFGVQIFRNNEQFLMSRVEGIPRIRVSHPTESHCEAQIPGCKSAYRSLRELSYCTDYTGDSPAVNQAHCKYEDATTIIPNGEVDNKVFIPTSVEIIEERRKCKPAPENGYTCDNEYEEIPGSDCLRGDYLCRTRGGKKDQFYFVADVKNFNVQFTSSYEQGDVSGTSLEHPAYYEICDDRVQAASKIQSWAERLHKNDSTELRCSQGNVRLAKLQCQEGVICRQKRDFDFFKDTGAKEAVESAQNLPGKSLHDLQDIVREQSFLIRKPITGDQKPLKQGRAKSTRFLRQPQHRLEVSSLQQHESQNASQAISVQKASTSKYSAERQKDSDSKEWVSEYGDVFTLERLMELAGADLDNNFNMDGWSSRESGTVLEVSAVYNNLHPFASSFGYKEVEYFYRFKELPLPFVSRKQLAPVQPPDYPETRRYEIRHGVLIWFRVQGEFGNYKSTYLLIYLVTAFALIGAASSATDFIAVYLHSKKNNYFNLKYDISPDFSDCWQCPKCGYWNAAIHDSCQKYGMWENSEEAQRCGFKPA